MPPKRIYWITSEKDREGYPPERVAFERLRAEGIEVIPTVWDFAPLPALSPDDHVIVRTPWDYLSKPAQFQAWLKALPEARVHNSAAILRWNSDKNYLRELESAGIPVVPTHWLDAATEDEVRRAVRDAFPGQIKIIKPVYSAGSAHTYRIGPDEFPPTGVFPRRPSMIQPYLSEIETDGERSQVFFGGTFSHAVRKRPRAGDFRVQESFGGAFSPFEPSEAELRFAARAIKTIRVRFPTGPVPLYARIDYVLVEGRPLLMEAELLEPDLYFHHASGSVDRFVAAVSALED